MGEYEQLELPLNDNLPSLFDDLMSGLERMNSNLKEVDKDLDWLCKRLGIDREEDPADLKKARAIAIANRELGEVRSLEQILDSARCEGNLLYLNIPNLNRGCYEQADKLIQLLGGKWRGGKTKAHVFKDDPQPILEAYRTTGELPDLNPLAYFATKPTTASLLATRIREENASFILDADAGTGALAQACRSRFPKATIHLVECDSDRAASLKQQPELGETFEEDFLMYKPNADYRCVILNPPFALKADRKAYMPHIFKAWNCLKAGQLIAIAPLGFTFSQDSRSRDFLTFVNQHGTYEELPPKSFEGTDVLAVAIYLEKS